MTQLRLTADILTAALEGFAVQKDQIDARIAEIKHLLNGSSAAPGIQTDTVKPRKKRSAALRRKMAMAQRARYAKLKRVAEPPQAVAAKPKKRKLSAAGRKAISDASKKRWAAVKAAKQVETPASAKKAVSKKAAAKKAA